MEYKKKLTEGASVGSKSTNANGSKYGKSEGKDKEKENNNESVACSHTTIQDNCAFCTKCSPNAKRVSGNSVRYIIKSNSFVEASTHSILSGPLVTPQALTTAKPRRERRLSIDRARIIKIGVLEGRSIHDVYKLKVHQLGKGSYGAVSKVKDLSTGAIRALKTVYKPKIENVTRLKREILIMKRLDHPNVARLYEVFEDETHLYLVMELCTGGEVFDRIIRAGHFSERYAAFIIRQVFAVIAYLHHNSIMHRDIKPENLLFVDIQPNSPLKLIDWGFAAKCDKGHKFSSIVGTPYYVAPEILFGNYDKQCDIWSCGVVLFILLCGYPPFYGTDNKEILRKVKIGEYTFEPRHWARVSEHAKDLIRRLLTYDPRKRPDARDSLNHPWIQYYTQGAVNSATIFNKTIALDVLEKFRTFAQCPRMKKLAVTIVAYMLSDKDVTNLHEIFILMDKDHDGVLSMEEFESNLEAVGVPITDEIRQLLNEVDTDDSGSIAYTEFVAACMDNKLLENDRICKQAFNNMDVSHSGYIGPTQIELMLQEGIGFSGTATDPVHVIQEVDLNADGKVDFNEFMRMMKSSSISRSNKHKKRYDAFYKAKTLFVK